jgi:hypothetical protein
MILTGITFPNNPGAEIVMKITNTATRQVWYVLFTVGEDISIASIYPLMQHWYKLEFFTSGAPVQFLLTNPDSTTVEGCCIEFIPNEGQEWDSAEFSVSTTNCVVE